MEKKISINSAIISNKFTPFRKLQRSINSLKNDENRFIVQ